MESVRFKAAFEWQNPFTLTPGSVKGVDSTASSSDAVAHAARLARDHGCVVAVSGEVDYVSACGVWKMAS